MLSYAIRRCSLSMLFVVPLRSRVRRVGMSPRRRNAEAKCRFPSDAATESILTADKDLEGQVRQTARLESLGVLAGGIAHDFNNLLVGILGNAELALVDAPAGGRCERALIDIIQAGQNAAALTRQILSYVGKSSPEKGLVDLSGLVREVAQLVHSSIPNSVLLELDLSDSLPAILGQGGQMRQVVMNLIINGGESIGEGRPGRVRVSTTMQPMNADDLRQDYPAAGLTAGNYVILEVGDDGKGMDEKILKRIFDPFFTTKLAGSGLGLAAVVGIVHGHRGGIRVSSEPGRGSNFRIVLPAVPAATPSLAPIPAIRDLHGTGLILVIDDEEMVLQVIRSTLELYGYRVVSAANGALGLQAVREHKDELALVILDSAMPVMSGEETLTYIKALAPAVPVILSSGYDVSRAISRSGERGLAAFLPKPFTATALLESVKSALLT